MRTAKNSPEEKKRWQTGINWGSEKNEARFRSGLSRWQAEGHEGKAKDFILWLMSRSGIMESDIGFPAQLEDPEDSSLFRIGAAKDRLLLSIADLIRETKANAESVAREELDQLREKCGFLQGELGRIQTENEKLEAEARVREKHLADLREFLRLTGGRPD